MFLNVSSGIVQFIFTLIFVKKKKNLQSDMPTYLRVSMCDYVCDTNYWLNRHLRYDMETNSWSPLLSVGILLHARFEVLVFASVNGTSG
jgi:hypothetical protein